LKEKQSTSFTRYYSKIFADLGAFDEKTDWMYEADDIRLCTMQRAIPEQKLGIFLCYHRSRRFHYIKFYGDFESSLAYRGGIRNFDRIIALNNINIENDTAKQLSNRFNVDRHRPLQMLVCSPATYEHYKSNKKVFDDNLSTIQRLRPAYATLGN